MYQIYYKFSPSRRWNMILVSGFWQNWSFWVVGFVGKRSNLVLYRTRESGWFLVLCVLGLFKRRIPPLSSKPLLLNFAMALWPCYVDLDHIWRGRKLYHGLEARPFNKNLLTIFVNSMAGPVTLKSPSRLVCWKLGF